MEKKTFSILKEIFQTALVSLGIFFFIYVLLVQPHRVKGESMIPNFSNGELILTEKISYRFGTPKRGDVVVFQAPTPQKVDFIKRIIGLPGEKIEIKDGLVIVDGNVLKEPYETQSTKGNLRISLSDNQYFVLGDNRKASSDSRTFGPIERKTIKGRAWVVYWPIFKTNQKEGARIISRVNYRIPNSF